MLSFLNIYNITIIRKGEDIVWQKKKIIISGEVEDTP